MLLPRGEIPQINPDQFIARPGVKSTGVQFSRREQAVDFVRHLRNIFNSQNTSLTKSFVKDGFIKNAIRTSVPQTEDVQQLENIERRVGLAVFTQGLSQLSHENYQYFGLQSVMLVTYDMQDAYYYFEGLLPDIDGLTGRT